MAFGELPEQQVQLAQAASPRPQGQPSQPDVGISFHRCPIARQSFLPAVNPPAGLMHVSGELAPDGNGKRGSHAQSVSIISSFVALISSMESNAVMLNIFTLAIKAW